MQLAQFKTANGIKLGIKTEQGMLDVQEAAVATNSYLVNSMEKVLATENSICQLQALIERVKICKEKETLFLNEDSVEFLPPITHPKKILCVGLNYARHAKETGAEIPCSPVLFSKFTNTLAAHLQAIPLPSTATQYDYEAELVIVIGKEAKDVSVEEALEYVFGYTVGNDLSARDLQFKTSQWLLGKTLDHFAPMGPYVTTADGVDPGRLTISLELNGEIRQSSTTQDMIFDCSAIVSYLSHYMTLNPGDLIFTGTPEGVIAGHSKEKQNWLKAGDMVRVTIEQLGTLENTLI